MEAEVENEEDRERKLKFKNHHEDESKTIIYVRGIPKEATNEELYALIPTGEQVAEIRCVRNGKGECKGYAYIEFKSHESCAESLRILGAQKIELRGGRLSFYLSKPPKSAGAASTEGEEEKKRSEIFLNNLPFSISEDEILERLGGHRESIEEVRLIRDQNGDCRGFGYLSLKESESEKLEEIIEHLR